MDTHERHVEQKRHTYNVDDNPQNRPSSSQLPQSVVAGYGMEEPKGERHVCITTHVQEEGEEQVHNVYITTHVQDT